MQLEKESQPEDIAIAKAIQRASHWIENVTPIDAIAQPCIIKTDNKKYTKEVPLCYICRRCNRPGHHISKCITNGDPAFDKPRTIQRASGIPRSFIKVLSSEGIIFRIFIILIFLEAKQNSNVFQTTEGAYLSIMPRSEQFAVYSDAVKQAKEASIPSHIACGLCKKLIKIPLNLPCCSTLTFCKACLLPYEENNEDPIHCPICNRECMAKNLILNEYVGTQVLSYIREHNKKKREAFAQLQPPHREKLVRY